jgi:hypothetical protein
MERRRRAALEHVLERGLEQVFDAARADLGHRLQAELEQRTAIGRQDAAVAADGQLALVQRVDELGAAVKVQRVRVAVAQVDQAVLDHARCHAQQHQQVLLHQAGAAGDVEHGGDLARRVVHRHRRAGELRELREEVVLAPHRHRPAGGQAGAHAVGAGSGLAPHATHAQAEWADFGGELGRRHHVHDDAIGVGEHDRGFHVGELLVQRGHFVARAGDHVGQALAALRELDAGHKRRVVWLAWMQAVLVEAAAPRLRDDVAAVFAQAAPNQVEDTVDMVVGFAHRQGHRRLRQANAANMPIV